MKKISVITICATTFIFLFCAGTSALAQSKAKVENVDFFLDGEKLVINYDIAKFKSDETFTVTPSIMTKAGKNISAFAFSGDVGKGVMGGKGKRIIWDLAKDNVFIDDEITVEVFAVPEKGGAPGKHVSVGGAIFKSLIFPGWGNCYAKGGGAYWLLGIAGYGLAGGAYMFSNKAYDAYEEYKLSEDPYERDQLFDDAGSYQDKQKLMMYSAAAIWGIDLIWTGIQAARANKGSKDPKVSVGYYYNPVARQPMFSVSYKF